VLLLQQIKCSLAPMLSICMQEAAIRNYKSDTLVVGAPQPAQQESDEDDEGEVLSWQKVSR